MSGDKEWADWGRLHSPKIKAKDRAGIHGWLHYLAGFSPRFVESVFLALRLRPGSKVLDPFVGAGTTAVVAKSRGLEYLGIDLNPVGCVVSRAKLAWGMANQSPKRYLDALSELRRGPAASPALSSIFRSCPDELRHLMAVGEYCMSLEPEVRDFLLAAVALTLRDLAKIHGQWNPTWLRQDFAFPQGALSRFDERLVRRCMRMHGDLQTYARSSSGTGHGEILFEDVKSFDGCGTFEAIVTSPPYLSRIDYFLAHRLENEFLWSADPQFRRFGPIQEMRLRQIGTVRVARRSNSSAPKSITAEAIVKVVRSHSSKASKSYYLPLLESYIEETQEWIARARSWLSQRGTAVVVVQTSYFKDVEIPLGSIIVEIAEDSGFSNAQIVHSEMVSGHRGRMDPEQRSYVHNKVLREEVVALKR